VAIFMEGRYPKQDIDNEGANKSFKGFPMRQVVGFDGQNLSQLQADALNVRMVEDGDVTYIAIAAPGTPLTTAKWQCRKIDQSAGFTLTFANGDGNFDNQADDLPGLSYS
jgi:hypothetical protein